MVCGSIAPPPRVLHNDKTKLDNDTIVNIVSNNHNLTNETLEMTIV